MDAATSSQVDAVVRLVAGAFGPDLVGAYLHGSAVLGGLRPTSDIDVLAVVSRSSTPAERRLLVQGLLDVSGSRARRVVGRPVELTVVVRSRIHPWHYPPPVELQYGEWLRDAYEDGFTPGPAADPDLALLLTTALRGTQPLAGPPLAQLVDPVPHRDQRRAALEGVPSLVDELADDTRNVLLTLARIWTTLVTGDIRSKDDAATWALDRLPGEHRDVMAAARRDYLGDTALDWHDRLDRATGCATWLVMELERVADPG